MSDFWTTDTPTREDEAFELLQFGAIQVNDDSEYPVAIARTERRMLNCARFYTKRVATLESEVAALKAQLAQRDEDAERYRHVRTQVANIGRFRMVGKFLDSETQTECEFEWWRGPAADAFDAWVDAAKKEQSK